MHVHARGDEALNKSLGIQRAAGAGDGGDDVHRLGNDTPERGGRKEQSEKKAAQMDCRLRLIYDRSVSRFRRFRRISSEPPASAIRLTDAGSGTELSSGYNPAA